MKKILITIFVFIVFFLTINNFAQAIQNKIIANVGNQIISSYELKNKIRTVVFLNKRKLNQEIIDQTKNQALRELIDFKLKKNEVEKFDIIANNENVQNHLKRISNIFDINNIGLNKVFENNQLDYELYYEEAIVEFKWQKLIYLNYKNQIFLGEEEIENELNKLIKKKSAVNEYSISEIEILLDKKKEIQNQIDEISKHINEQGFEKTAIKFSSSPSALSGGDMGWINAKSLSTDISEILQKMETGEISDPIIKSGSFIILKLKEKRKINIDTLNVEEIKRGIVKRKQNELFELFSNSYLSKLKNNTYIETK